MTDRETDRRPDFAIESATLHCVTRSKTDRVYNENQVHTALSVHVLLAITAIVMRQFTAQSFSCARLAATLRPGSHLKNLSGLSLVIQSEAAEFELMQLLQ